MREIKSGRQFRKDLKRYRNDNTKLKKLYDIVGYLVAFEISDDVMEEMERLNRSFGIGVILLSSYTDDTKILFQARKKELDYYTIDKLCRINPDFRNFITKTTRVLNAQSDVLEDVKSGLQHFCDKVFYSQEELLAYCKECHIPC